MRPDPSRLARRYADLKPPLGYPGGACHLIERIDEKVKRPKTQEKLIRKVEEAKDLDSTDEHQVYQGSQERMPPGTMFKKIFLSPHAQHRMDLRGITLNQIRAVLMDFHKTFSKEKSQRSPQFKRLEQDIQASEKIRWSYGGVIVVFKVGAYQGKRAALVVTVHYDAQRKPGPVSRAECKSWEGWSDLQEYPESQFERNFPRLARPAATGDCYEAAGKYIMDNALFPFGSQPHLRLVHGEVTGQGQLDGVNYGHAWVEDGNTVIDVSNGGNLRMPKAKYYAVGNIKNNNNIHVYTPEEFRRKVVTVGHWGPWDLKTSTGL